MLAGCPRRLAADADHLARRPAEAVAGRPGPDLDEVALARAQRCLRSLAERMVTLMLVPPLTALKVENSALSAVVRSRRRTMLAPADTATVTGPMAAAVTVAGANTAGRTEGRGSRAARRRRGWHRPEPPPRGEPPPGRPPERPGPGRHRRRRRHRHRRHRRRWRCCRW